MTRWMVMRVALMRPTILLLAGMLSVGMVLTGCSAKTPSPGTAASVPETASEALPEVAAYVFPSVPFYPATTAHSALSGQRAYIHVKGEGAANVLAWYQSALQEKGWQTEHTGLPPDTVLLFAREGQYLSISGRDGPDDWGGVLWFHLRTAREVTREEALLIASETHRDPVDWTATLIPDYESEWYGVGIRHPVWVVKASPGLVAVWVDAITAQPFRIRE